MKLLIVESPAKAKTISNYLGGEYDVVASVGHIRDLPKNNKKAIDIDAGFIPHYEIPEEKKQTVLKLKKAAGKADEVLLATDPDREGEAIAWHIKEAIGLKNPLRVVFHEITKDAVRAAIKTPRQIDDNLRIAQEARRVLDRLVGYDLSGLIWKKVRYGLSAGRVQSPALRIVVEREREIRKFCPEQFFIISAALKPKEHAPLIFTCKLRPSLEEEAERIVAEAKKHPFFVEKIKEEGSLRKTRPPFITSTLQQTASTRFGLSPSMTMRIAQSLYEKGHITYMRTDSTNIGAVSLAEIEKTVKSRFGAEYFQANRHLVKSKNAQEAHEAIRPTNISATSIVASDQEKKVYQMIWQRTVASQMADAKIKRSKIVVAVKGADVPNFSVNGSRIEFDGWLAADPLARGDDIILPELKEGEIFETKDVFYEKKETNPPARFTEAGLIRELEKRGIGRPSTYAAIIKTLLGRVYVVKEGRALVPTDTGEVVSKFLEDNFNNIISDSFTAEMENGLDKMALGELDYRKTLTDFYSSFSEEVKSKENIPKVTVLGEADSSNPCPLCGSLMHIKLARHGKFLSCSKFPECSGSRTIDGAVLEPPQKTDTPCPKCEKGNLMKRTGRFGEFLSCERYPKCKYIHQDKTSLPSTGVSCPSCDKGELVERRGRFGLFYSCSGYPDCKYAIKAKPTGDKCKYQRDGKECGALLMEGTKTIPIRCSDKQCPNHNPHKLPERK